MATAGYLCFGLVLIADWMFGFQRSCGNRRTEASNGFRAQSAHDHLRQGVVIVDQKPRRNETYVSSTSLPSVFSFASERWPARSERPEEGAALHKKRSAVKVLGNEDNSRRQPQRSKRLCSMLSTPAKARCQYFPPLNDLGLLAPTFVRQPEGHPGSF
jgi:hypothetical protein